MTPQTGEDPFLQQCVDLAAANVEGGGGPFGALVVAGGLVIATGVNRVTLDLDPTAHAEVTAIRAACIAMGTFSLAGCTLYSSCEPCPMCLASALWSRVDAIVYAADRDDAATAGFDDRAFYELFEDTPRAQWTVPVTQAALQGRVAPFQAWSAKTDRIDY
ncbi:MAG: tRNA-specific adenosine deaminase [Pseudonocardiales bacterium]|nr:tRNA-specific adenosine deaminase [Pseudonocardiales bacterium]